MSRDLYTVTLFYMSEMAKWWLLWPAWVIEEVLAYNLKEE